MVAEVTLGYNWLPLGCRLRGTLIDMNKSLAVALVLLATALASGTASAHGPRGRVHFGVHIGAPLWYYPSYYYPPAYYYPPPYYPPVIVQSSPPVYVERPAEPAAAQEPAQQGWWYYCEQTRGYYPYVKTCPGGWQRVAPAPAPAGG